MTADDNDTIPLERSSHREPKTPGLAVNRPTSQYT
jgi:hypothetical protein